MAPARRSRSAGRYAGPASIRWSSRPSSSASRPRVTASTSSPAGSSPREHALPQQELAGTGQPLATRRQHLADAGLAIRLRPGLDERDLARVAVVVVDRLDVQGDRDRQPFGGGPCRRQAMSELVEAARRELVAGQPDQLVLAREVAVDGPDRQAALADDVRDGRAVVALLAEDAGRGGQDPVPDLLLVGGADTGHDLTPKENGRSSQSSAPSCASATIRS